MVKIIDTFRNFIEIEGLKRKLTQHLLNITKENKRISDMTSKRRLAEERIQSCELEIKSFKSKEHELNIESETSKLNKLKNQINSVKNERELTSINHEIEHSTLLLQRLEEEFFKNLETIELLEIEIKTNKDFHFGSSASLLEITKEVEEKIFLEQKEIENYKRRIDGLLEIEPTTSRKLYLDTNTKFSTTSPCAFIMSKNCSACRINIDSVTIANVENARSLELCPSCGRILLPQNLNIY